MPINHQNITSLLVLCREKNQLAQLEVYNRYQHAMYNTAYRIVKNTAEAEDIMQESFITAFNMLDSIKGDASFGSWLKRIVINKSINIYHQSKKFITIDVENLEEEIDETIGFSSEEITQLKTKQVLQCMNTLNPNYQQVLTLHYIEGLDYEEICELLTISYGNCRTLLSRAKNSLRKKLHVENN